MRKLLSLFFIAFGRCALAFGVRKEVTSANLRSAFLNEPVENIDRLLKKTYDNLSIVFSEFVYLRFARRKSIVEGITFLNPDLYHSSHTEGKGVIVLSSHYANWEWMALGGAPQLGTLFHIVVKNINVGVTEKFLHRMRKRFGNLLLNSGDVRGMFYVLKNGGSVALLGDQAAPPQSTKAIFFGKNVPTFEGPARLALRTRAPILYAHLDRGAEGQYSIQFFDIDYSDLLSDTPQNIQLLTQRHVSLLEKLIRKKPELWLWQHRRWKNAA